jgi:4,5-DOPA dioxygenase extradiol
MPVLFVSHGPPTLALEAEPALVAAEAGASVQPGPQARPAAGAAPGGAETVRHWRALPGLLPEAPAAILCVSAHWDAPTPRLSGGVPHPRIQHDFFGFPAPLYRITWPVRGSGEWAERVAEVFGKGLQTDRGRPLDHGAWVPLRHAWPQGEVPVLQLSLSTGRGGEWHLDLGRRLGPLAEEGVLIVGSGGITHNLGRIARDAPEGASAPWAEDFVAAAETALERGDTQALADPWKHLPHGRDAHPTLEHYFPLLVAVGAAGGSLAPIHRAWTLQTLGLHTYASGALAGAARDAA